VLNGSLLLGFSHRNRGQYFCLDAATGKTLWKGEGRQGENAAMLIAGSLVFSLSNDGDLFVTKTSSTAGLEAIRTYHVAESPTWAHPILVGRRVLVKDATTLALWTIE
jgi:outer membrane protein assembly factor BamB